MQGGFLKTDGGSKFEGKCAEILGVQVNVNYLRRAVRLKFRFDCDTWILADLLLQTNDDEDMIVNEMGPPLDRETSLLYGPCIFGGGGALWLVSGARGRDFCGVPNTTTERHG